MAVTASSTADLPRLGILLMLSAWLLFSFVDLGAKWLAVAGIPAFQLAFMRYAGHFVISLGVIAKGGVDLSRFKTDHPWQANYMRRRFSFREQRCENSLFMIVQSVLLQDCGTGKSFAC